MAQFNIAKAFRKIRAESQRKKVAILEAGRGKREAWAAYGRRSAVLNCLRNLFPSETAGSPLDVRSATARMIEYAETLPTEWVRARVKLVHVGMATLAAQGRPVRDADLKSILLNLLLYASAGNNAKVAEVFNEVKQGDADDVETFRLCLVNWLADKVVDPWPPLPDELKQPVASVESPKAVVKAGSNTEEAGLSGSTLAECDPASERMANAERKICALLTEDPALRIAKRAVVIKKAGVRKKDGLAVLRKLQQAGDYAGLSAVTGE
jgi:hypothetical protein